MGVEAWHSGPQSRQREVVLGTLSGREAGPCGGGEEGHQGLVGADGTLGREATSFHTKKPDRSSRSWGFWSCFPGPYSKLGLK